MVAIDGVRCRTGFHLVGWNFRWAEAMRNGEDENSSHALRATFAPNKWAPTQQRPTSALVCEGKDQRCMPYQTLGDWIQERAARKVARDLKPAMGSWGAGCFVEGCHPSMRASRVIAPSLEGKRWQAPHEVMRISQ